jgi:cellulose biosynthesis protein BcsQ
MMRGHSVMLVDSTDTPMLREYFGVGDFTGSVCTLVDQHSADGGRVHLVLRNSLPASGGKHWVTDGISQVGDRCDFAIADMGTLMDGCSDSDVAHSQELVVLTPDIRSAVAIPQIQREFEEREQQAGRRLQRAYVLNQYRPEARLHVELRDRFAGQLGSHFLGSLSWSELVGEAVAHGQTIFDYAPGSQAAEEFSSLGNAVDEMLRQPEAMSAHAGR